MNQFVVKYKSERGNTKIFGPFDSHEEAAEWMETDVEKTVERLDNGNDEYFFNRLGNSSMEIEGYGTWAIELR